MCRSQKCILPGGLLMSCASSAVKRCFLVVGVLLLVGLTFSQEKPKKSKGVESKPAVATQPAQPGTAVPRGTETQPQPAAAAEDEEEPKGPWHGLTWRL